MRNKYPGACYRCGEWVPVGAGHFERFRGGWRVQHADCAIEHRGTLDPERHIDTIEDLKRRAAGTGKKASKARRRLRRMGLMT